MRNFEDIKIGDRFRLTESFKIGRDETYEVLSRSSAERYFNAKCLETDERADWQFVNPEVWEYLGNFSKGEQFQTLYDKLNG